ncbi:hypothetical protein LY78DRAFT_679517 [Colletotrichum sublineola]|nr:hypothetical protein LY78DRAFT_679517 [Colletotrichum sublineola]
MAPGDFPAEEQDPLHPANVRNPFPIPKQYWGQVDVEQWGNTYISDIPADASEDKRRKALAAIVVFRMMRYTREGLCGTNLWDALQDDFEGWTEEDFVATHRDTLTGFRDHLLRRGIFINTTRGGRIAPRRRRGS